MIGRAGRPQFDDKGVAVVYVESSKKNFYRKFLNDPFPIESSLMDQGGPCRRIDIPATAALTKHAACQPYCQGRVATSLHDQFRLIEHGRILSTVRATTPSAQQEFDTLLL